MLASPPDYQVTQSQHRNKVVETSPLQQKKLRLQMVKDVVKEVEQQPDIVEKEMIVYEHFGATKQSLKS